VTTAAAEQTNFDGVQRSSLVICCSATEQSVICCSNMHCCFLVPEQVVCKLCVSLLLWLEHILALLSGNCVTTGNSWQRSKCLLSECNTQHSIGQGVNTKCWHLKQNTPCLVECSIFIGKIACTVRVFRHCNPHSCCHKSAGLCNIVTEHGVGTHQFVPFLCSGLDLASCFLGCTAVPGPERAT